MRLYDQDSLSLCRQPMSVYALYVILLVLFCDLNVSSSRLEVVSDNLAELVIFYAEGVLNDVGDIVLTRPG